MFQEQRVQYRKEEFSSIKSKDTQELNAEYSSIQRRVSRCCKISTSQDEFSTRRITLKPSELPQLPSAGLHCNHDAPSELPGPPPWTAQNRLHVCLPTFLAPRGLLFFIRSLFCHNIPHATRESTKNPMHCRNTYRGGHFEHSYTACALQFPISQALCLPPSFHHSSPVSHL